MVKIDMSGFRPAQFKTNQLALKSGGYLSNCTCPLDTKDVKLGASMASSTFICIKTRESWLALASFGKSMRTPIFAGVLSDLQDAIMAAEQRIRNGTSADGLCQDDEEDDPMNEMTAPPADMLTYYQKRKKNHKRGLPFMKQVCQIPMKELPPEMTPDSTNPDKMVKVYLEGNGKLWLHQDELNWLLHYLCIQQQIKGGVVAPSDDESPDAPDSMEGPVTPVQCQQPPRCVGNLHDKWSMAPR